VGGHSREGGNPVKLDYSVFSVSATRLDPRLRGNDRVMVSDMLNLTDNDKILDGVLLGIDYGLKRIGLAVCDSEGRVAVGAGRIEAPGPKQAMKQVVGVARERKVAGVVLGQPSATRGNEDVMEGVEKIALELKNAGFQVALWPERFSTASALAERKFYGGKGSGAKSWADEAAAIIILQDYLDWRRQAVLRSKLDVQPDSSGS